MTRLMTTDDRIKHSAEIYKQRLKLRADDGLLVLCAKIFLRILCVARIHWFHVQCLRLLVWLIQCVASIPVFKKCECFRHLASKDRWHSQSQFQIAIDCYMIVWTAILGGCYGMLYWQIQDWPSFSPCLRWDGNWWPPICIAFTFIRMIELTSFLLILHADAKYSPPNEFRAVINTIWHYLEGTIAFATFYVFITVCASDAFTDACGGQFLADFTTPLYFSFVTITTLGYGDFSPQSIAGKVLVASQVLFGLFLLIVILQRAISLRQSKEKMREQ